MNDNKKRNSRKRNTGKRIDERVDRKSEGRNDRRKSRPEWLRGKEEVVVSDYTNDVEFYNESPVMFAATCSLPGSAGQGYSNPIPKNTLATAEGSFGIPGFIAYNFISTPGYANPDGGYINVTNNVANNLFTKVRMNKNGTAPYTKSDLVMYIMMLDELYSEWFSLRRALGVLNLPHPVNGYTPQDFLTALGLTGDSNGDEVANCITKLNYLSTMINQWPIPTDFKMVQRHADMLSAIYTDSQDMHCQYFAFTKYGYRKWVDDTKTGTTLTYTPYGTATTILSRLNQLEDNLILFQKSESAALIRADIITAYSDKGSYRLPGVDSNYVVPVVFDSVINMQVHNMDIVGQVQDNTLNISENVDRNELVFTPSIMSGATPTRSNLLFDADVATPEMVAEATRLKFMYDNATENTFGTELVITANVYAKIQGTMAWRFSFTNFWGPKAGQQLTSILGAFQVGAEIYCNLSVLMSFAVRPYAYFLNTSGTDSALVYTFAGYLCDTNLVVPLTFSQLHAINITCLNSEFGLLRTFDGRTGTQG